MIHDRVRERATELCGTLGSSGRRSRYCTRADIGVGVPEGSIELLRWFLRGPPGRGSCVSVGTVTSSGPADEKERPKHRVVKTYRLRNIDTVHRKST